MERQTTPEMDNYSHFLMDPHIHEVRMSTCRACASNLEECGKVLWAFGLPMNNMRRGLALIVQMGGALAQGATLALDAGNQYSAAALLRQFVEIEYLLYLFGKDPKEAERWYSASPEDLRKVLSPASMRKRSKGRFQDDEYWSHCEIGGHPHPRSGFLLPEHDLLGRTHFMHPPNGLWVDLGQHLTRAFGFLELPQMLPSSIPVVSGLIDAAKAKIHFWHNIDFCAKRRQIPLFAPP